MHDENKIVEFSEASCCKKETGRRQEITPGFKTSHEPVCRQNPLLSLDLSSRGIASQQLLEIIEKNDERSWTKLDLSKNNIGELGGLMLADLMTKTSTLTVLNVSSCGLGEPGACSIAEALAVHKQLVHLDLSRNNLGEAGARAVGEALALNGTIDTLNISHNYLGPGGAKYIARGLACNQSLHTLDLADNDLREDGLETVGQALSRNHALKSLDLSSNHGTGGANFDLFAQGLMINSHLEALCLGSNRLAEDAARTLSVALMTNQTLMSLDLKFNRMAGPGVSYLANALKHNSTLKSFSLFGNELGEDDAYKLADALKSNTTLAELDVSNREYSIPEQGRLAIAEALRDTMREDGFKLRGFSLRKLASQLGLPAEATRWSNGEIVRYCSEIFKARALAFAMGTHTRLGALSPMRVLSDDSTRIVIQSAFGMCACGGKGSRGSQSPESYLQRGTQIAENNPPHA
jgi:hypothetical protein